jgi:hypothetical protein
MTDDATNREPNANSGASCSDAELLRCYADEGSQTAFVRFVERHLPLVCVYAQASWWKIIVSMCDFDGGGC